MPEIGETLNTILVFQMAKVASRSWLHLLNDQFPDSLVDHFHSISDESLAKIALISTAKGPEQTFQYMTLPRLGRPPESIEPFVENGRWTGPPVSVVAGMRDPVARAVSLIGFSANRFGYTKYPVTVRDGGTPETLSRFFFESLRLAQQADRIAPNDTLLTQMAHAMYDYRRWFCEELNPAFGFSVFDTSFDHQAKALRIDGEKRRLFVYRVEDLSKEDASQALVTSASDFFGKPMPKVPAEATEGERRFRGLYKEFVAHLRLNAQDLDWFYDHDCVRHFYTDAEIQIFRERWAA